MALDLCPTITFGDLTLTSYPYAVVMDYDLGVGEVTYSTLVSAFVDGESISGDRTTNREISLTVMVEGATLGEVAENVAALSMECDKRNNTLGVHPGDPLSVGTVFDTYRAQLNPQPSDKHEMNLVRLCELTIPAHPFARSVFPTTRVAASGAGVVIDDCASAVGWSAESGTVAVSSGAVVNTRSRETWGILLRAGAVDLADTPYVAVEWSSSTSVFIGFQDAATLTHWPEAYRESVGSNIRSYFHSGGQSIGPSGFRLGTVNGITGGTMTFSVHEVSAVSTLPDSGTAGHQQLLMVAPGGSARTQAQIEVTHDGGDGLGEVVLYTAPAGSAYMPSMRRWLAGSYEPLVPDPAGASQRLDTASWYDIPAPTIPVGGYTLAATMMNPVTEDVPISWMARTFIGGIERGRQEGTTTVSFIAGRWITTSLALVTLPPARVGPDGFVRIDIVRGSGSTSIVHLYDTYVFHEMGDLTIAFLGIGTAALDGPSSRLRIMPPSAAYPGGAVERGYATDWSDAHSAGEVVTARPARGHVLHPEGTSVFVYAERTPTDSPATVSATWFKRWHTHAAED